MSKRQHSGSRERTGGFSVRITADFDVVVQNLKRIQRVDIPKSKASAFARVGDQALSAAATAIAAQARVPKWMVRGVGGGAGTKKGGARIRRTGYIRSKDGIIFILMHKHINPTGTNAKAATVTTFGRRSERTVNNAAKKKASADRLLSLTYGGVRASGRTYPDAFHRKTDKGNGAIFTRFGKHLEMETIELDPWAGPMLQRVCRSVVKEKFEERFRHELQRRAGKRKR